MADMIFYRKYLNTSSVDEICKVITSTLIETNCTYDFLVNWDKVIQNRDIYKYETALLKSIKNSRNPVSDLTNLLTKYPNVIRVIPVLLACRDGIVKVLDSIEKGLKYKDFHFEKEKYTDDETKDIVQFTEKTGLLDMLCHMDSATDYLLGIEVGLDTNARKNRSGLFLEKITTETIQALCDSHDEYIFVSQKNFRYIKDTYNIQVPTTLIDRKFDYVIINRGKPTSVEVNYYGGTGSKPSEIVSSYINRGQELTKSGWKFI